MPLHILVYGLNEGLLINATIVLLIKEKVVIMIVTNVFLLKVLGNEVKNDLSQLIQFGKLFNVVIKNLDFLIEDYLDFGHRHPRVIENLVSEKPYVLVAYHFSNELNDLFGLVFPLRRAEVQFALFDGIQNLFI